MSRVRETMRDDGHTATDENEPRRVGRPVRAMLNPFTRCDAARAPKCRECPKWSKPIRVCRVRGVQQSGDEVACRYGVVLIRAKRVADRRASAAASHVPAAG